MRNLVLDLVRHIVRVVVRRARRRMSSQAFCICLRLLVSCTVMGIATQTLLNVDTLFSRALRQRETQSLKRLRRRLTPAGAVHVHDGTRDLVNFSSNNYLGLTHHPRMLNVARADSNAGCGAGAAGLVSGHTPDHARAEADLAKLKSTDAAILLPSGYQANLAVVQAIVGAADSVGQSVRFLVDKLAHASLIDAVRQHDVSYRVFPHNGLAKLERLLNDAPANQLQVVLTESVFSMDGDTADLRGLAELKQRHAFMLVVDEAHATGVYGDAGAGLVNEIGVRDAVDVSVVTLSKALGVSGGAVCASADFIGCVENFGRAFIYSTAVAPIIARLASEAISICKDEPHLARRVRELARHVRAELKIESEKADSPIIPLIVGDPARALHAAKVLYDAGLLVVAVRPPTVAPGTSRLRITLSAAHTDADVEQLIRACHALTHS